MSLRAIILREYRAGKSVEEIYTLLGNSGHENTLHYTSLKRYIKRIIYVYERSLRQVNQTQRARETVSRTVECCNCHTSRLRRNTREFNNRIYCNRCFNAYITTCAECNTLLYRSDSRRYNAQLYCLNCYEKVRPILDYQYSPAQYNKVKLAYENTQYMGIELEVEYEEGGDINKKASEFKQYLNSLEIDKYFYLKYDGSLDYGMEIVTHPFTFAAKSKLRFKEILEWLDKNKFSSYSNGHCGLHVHMSNEKMGNKNKQNLRLFFFRCKDMLDKVSFRKGKNTQYCQFEDGLSKSTLLRNIYPEGRYWAINFHSTKPTVEFRLFRGTLNYDRFLANLTLCEALIAYLKGITLVYLFNNSEAEIWKNFIEYVKVNYINLYDFYKKEKLLCV